MSEKAILEALQKAVIAAVAALPSEDRVPVKYVGRNFTKPSDGSGWLEVVHIPNNQLNDSWGSEKTYRGMMRLILHWPMKDKGAYKPIELIEDIASYFVKGRKLTDQASTVSIMIADVPDFKGVMEEPPEMMLPMSIRYEFFAA